MKLERLLVLTGDPRLPDPTKFGGGYSPHDLTLHQGMVDALQSLGRWQVEIFDDHAGLVDRLRRDPPDLVFNLCDTGFRNVATHELHVPALLELLGVPYTGAPPAAMVLAYDKALVQLMAAALNVPVPQQWEVAPNELPPSEVAYPAFLKPACGDGSVGINRNAVVNGAEQLAQQLAWVRQEVPNTTVLIQEYLPGPEYGLALVGNPGSLRALPPLVVDFSSLPADLPRILAFESKTGPATEYANIAIKPATLPATLLQQVTLNAERLFLRIGLRDYARFDFRTASDGTLRLMEVNPNPAWDYEAKLALMAGFAGIDYAHMLELLVDTAWARVASGG